MDDQESTYCDSDPWRGTTSDWADIGRGGHRWKSIRPGSAGGAASRWATGNRPEEQRNERQSEERRTSELSKRKFPIHHFNHWHYRSLDLLEFPSCSGDVTLTLRHRCGPRRRSLALGFIRTVQTVSGAAGIAHLIPKLPSGAHNESIDRRLRLLTPNSLSKKTKKKAKKCMLVDDFGV